MLQSYAFLLISYLIAKVIEAKRSMSWYSRENTILLSPSKERPRNFLVGVHFGGGYDQCVVNALAPGLGKGKEGE